MITVITVTFITTCFLFLFVLFFFLPLGMVPPFVNVQTFCASRDIRVSWGICPLIQQYFCAAYDYVEKADPRKGYQNPKRKLGVTTHFSEIIELNFVKKLPYILCILTLFLELSLLNYLWKMRGYPHFSLSQNSNNSCKDPLFPHSRNLCKNTSVLRGTVLNLSCLN